MSQTSAFGKWIKLHVSSFDENQSVATAHAHVMRNNFAQLTDSSTQVRLHWESTDDPWESEQPRAFFTGPDRAVSRGPAVYHQEFPISWLGSAKPSNLDIIVQTQSFHFFGSETVNRRILVVPASTPVATATRPLLDIQDTCADEAIDTWSGTITGSDHLSALESCWEPIYTAGDPAITLYMCMLRLEVWLEFEVLTLDGTDSHTVTYAFIREFA